MLQNEEYTSNEIIKRICDCGYKAYLTGGAVRDEFLDVTPSDFDIVTDATPEELQLIFVDKKVKSFGASFLVTSVDGIDVATYRSDRNSGPGRQNCISTECKTLEEDLSRRDFTFNAFAICPYTGEIVDPFNGRKDLENKTLRFVGDPNQRIYEDYLRMIRAARFACLIEGRVDTAAFNAIRRNKELVKEISPERIRMELLKVMKYRRPSIFFDILHHTGILEIILPDFDKMYGHTGGKYHNETLDEHAKLTGDNLSNKFPLLRLVGYLHDIGKPVTYDGENFINHEKVGSQLIKEIFNQYRFSKDETSFAKYLVKLHMRSLDYLPSEKSVRRLLKKFDENHISWKHWLRLKIADKKANLAIDDYTRDAIKIICLKIQNAKNESKSGGFKVTDLEINGNDVINTLQIQPGPKVGSILKDLLEIVIDNPELNTKDSLNKILVNLGNG